MSKRRVALVTGASAGIGRSVAEELAQLGYLVVGCARRTERLEQLSFELAEQGLEFVPKTCDLRSENSIVTMFEDIQKEFGGVDVLINNAGLGHRAPLLSGETKHWREMLEVNILALCVCTREAVAQMRMKGDDGYVIHISSMAGHRVPSGSGVYSATKFAVRSLTEGLRMELRALNSGIRVSSISPGFVETEFAEQYSKSAEQARITYGRYKVLEAVDIAKQVSFLLQTPAHVQIHDLLVRPTAQEG